MTAVAELVSASSGRDELRYDEFSRRKYFGSLDGLRAISIVGVVWFHASRGRPLFLAPQGAMGVPLFFAISGFLITTLLLRERDRTGDIAMGAFYVRRSLRILPLYYSVLFVYTALVLAVEHGEPKWTFLHNLPFYLTYTSNWFVPNQGTKRVIFYFAWSLATEEQFYFCWPSIEKRLGRSRTNAPVAVALALVALQVLVFFDVIALDHESLLRRVIVSIAPAVCFGVVLAHALHDRRSFPIAAKLLGQRWLSPVLLVAVVVILHLPGPGWALVAYLAMTLLVGACVVDEQHGLAWLLRSRPFSSLGQVSYGIYLMHMLVVSTVEHVLAKGQVTATAIVFPLQLAGAWGVAWVSFHFYEARFLKLKGRFAR